MLARRLRLASQGSPVSLSLLLLAGLAAPAADAAPDLDSTALRVLLDEQPDADLRSPVTQQALAERRAELGAIFDMFLTDAGRHAFYQEPPVVLGEVLVRFTPAATQLVASHLAGLSAPLAGSGLGLPDVDAVLRRHGATAIERLPPDDDFDIHVSTGDNPSLVARELASLPETVKATPNALNDFNSYAVARRAVHGGTPVYELTAGWGDCYGGCSRAHRVEFAVTAKGDQRTALKLGESGEPLPSELQQRLFKTPAGS